MIGRQINFYLAGDDQRELLTAINQEAGCALLCRTDHSPYLEKSQFDRDGGDWAAAYLCEPSSINVVLKSILAGTADASEILAIEFMQPTFDGSSLQRGRFWYAPKAAIGNALSPKPKSFVDWASKVLKITKRELRVYRNGDLIGREALALQKSDRLELVA